MSRGICAVATCTNAPWKTKHNSRLLYHSFPRDATRKAEWLRLCKQDPSMSPSRGTICSAHFTEDDYETDLKHQLLNLPLRRLLKRSAVPSLRLPGSHDTDELRIERKRRALYREYKQIVKDALAAHGGGEDEATNEDISLKVLHKVENMIEEPLKKKEKKEVVLKDSTYSQVELESGEHEFVVETVNDVDELLLELEVKETEVNRLGSELILVKRQLTEKEEEVERLKCILLQHNIIVQDDIDL